MGRPPVGGMADMRAFRRRRLLLALLLALIVAGIAAAVVLAGGGSGGGSAAKQALSDLLSAAGRLRQVLEVDAKRNVMASMRWTNDWVNRGGRWLEYLFLLEKT